MVARVGKDLHTSPVAAQVLMNSAVRRPGKPHDVDCSKGFSMRMTLEDVANIEATKAADEWRHHAEVSHSSALLEGSLCYTAMEAVSAPVMAPDAVCLKALGHAQVRLAKAGCTNTDLIAFCKLHPNGGEEEEEQDRRDKGRAGAMADMVLDQAMAREMLDAQLKTDDAAEPSSESWPSHRHQVLREDESVIGVGSSDLAPVNPKDHGAAGNCTRMQTTGPRCYVDDTIALQQAIDWAQITGRSLLIPAGIYAISKPLFVHCTGALELIHHNGPVKIMPKAYICTGIEGKAWYHPLRISGEGKEITVIMATKPMKAVLTIGKSTNVSLGIHVEKLHLHANNLADHGLLAQGVIRSRFSYVAASQALQIGMKLQDGFILYVQDCDFVKNVVAGLWLEANANGVEVSDCSLSNNEQLGVYIERGNQVSVARNMIEGNGGPGIFAYDTLALDLNSNYFEANCCGIYAKDAKFNPQPYTLRPPSPSPIFGNYSNARDIAVNADIVVSGVAPPYYGTGDAVRSLRISGSRFDGGCGYQHGASGFGPSATWNPNAANGSLVLLIAADDVVLESNQKSYPGDHEPAVSLVATGPGGDGRLFNVSGDVSILGGFGLGQDGIGLVHSLSEDCKVDCGQPFHQYHIAGTPQANFAKSAANASNWQPHRATAGPVLNGVQLYTLSGSPAATNGSAKDPHLAACPSPHVLEGSCSNARSVSVGNCLVCVGTKFRGLCIPTEMDSFCATQGSDLDNVIVLEFDMAAMPILQGQLTYFGVQTTAAYGTLRLAIDRGDGQWQYGFDAKPRCVIGGSTKPSSQCPPKPTAWREQSFAQVMQRSGIARFALASNATVGVGQAVVAKVGAAWSDVAFKNDA